MSCGEVWKHSQTTADARTRSLPHRKVAGVIVTAHMRA